ncbi:integrase family protein (plasmid) [Oceanithermus profundus DSM 14977]|uniref:Integrase family protein n=1 Tax=Oceanithermus profundus (strain DSM 14977 / NBRC 100410 / VKM B-2274 / 506) TaxID=670487 RepID=E4UAQ8_OCEP5|nr:tyrosine-type recombinase/integrase [Oceanithermus profundus]ADR37837.1 integrase family protein [Oceanithermus profundus DSM 14977]
MLVPTPAWDDPAKRRRWALGAANERDVDLLLRLLAYYMMTKGRQRSRTSLRTYQLYGLAVRDWIAWAWPPEVEAPQVPLLKATEDDVDRWLADLLDRGGHLSENPWPLSPSTAAAYLSGLRAFYRALVWAGAVAKNPAAEVRAPRDPTPRSERRPALPYPLYIRLLEHLSGDEAQQVRDRAVIRLMGDAGLRIAEVEALDVKDVDLGEHVVVVRAGKGGKQRTVPMTRALSSALVEWLGVRRAYAAPGEEALFVNLGGRKAKGRRLRAHSIRRFLEGYYRELGFPERYRGAHTLRHLAGTRFYQASRDIHVVAALLGHENVGTSTVYAKMDRSRLRAVVEGLGEK